MTAEGVFPKVPGDISYASEANRFAGGGLFISQGSTVFIGSASGYQSAGSIVIPAAYMINPVSQFVFNFATITSAGGASIRFNLSGAGITTGSAVIQQSTNAVGNGRIIFVSGVGSGGRLYAQFNAQDDSTTQGTPPNQFVAMPAMSGFNMGSSYVLSFNLGSIGPAGGSAAFSYYILSQEGRGY